MNIRRDSIAIILLLTIETMGFAFIAPVITPLLLKSQWLVSSTSRLEHIFIFGFFNAIYPLCLFIFTPFLGGLSDRLGRKKTFYISLLGTCFGYLLTGIGIQYGSLSLALSGRAIDGMTAGSVPIAQAAMSDISKTITKRTRLMGLTVFGFAGGQTLGPLLSGVLSDANLSHWFGPTLPFYVVGALSVFNLFWLWWRFQETLTTKIKSGTNFLSDIFKEYAVIKYRKVWLCSLSFLLLQLAVSLFMQNMPVVFTEIYNYTGLHISMFSLTAGIVIGVSVLFILPLLLKYFNVATIVQSLFATQACGLMLASLAHSTTLYWISMVLVLIGTSQAYSSFLTLFSACSNAEHQGSIMGISAAIIGLSWTISAMLTGLLPLIGNLTTAFSVALAFSVLGLFSLSVWIKYCSDGVKT